MSGFYLTLMQGVTTYDEEFKSKGKKYCEQVTNYFKNEFYSYLSLLLILQESYQV